MSPLSADACPECGGRGDVRIKGRPGWERRTCPRCGGDGQMKPDPRHPM